MVKCTNDFSINQLILLILISFSVAPNYYYLSINLDQFIGVLGWLDTPLPSIIIFLYFTVLLFFALSDHNDQTIINFRKKFILLISVTSGVLIIITSIYLQFNSIGNTIIEGIQGRYFIPLSPLVFLLLYNKKINFMTNLYSQGISIIIFCSNILTYTLYVLISRYYHIS